MISCSQRRASTQFLTKGSRGESRGSGWAVTVWKFDASERCEGI